MRWGAPAWRTLHAMAWAWPERPTEAERRDMRAFLYLFARHLPCAVCARHFRRFLDERDLDRALASKMDLVTLLHEAHNAVNVRLGKRCWTLQEHCLEWDPGRQGERRRRSMVVMLVSTLVLLLVLHEKNRRHRGQPAAWRPTVSAFA